MPKLPTAKTLTNAPPMNGWRRVKFGDVVRFVKENADPESGEFEQYVAGEHIETDNLHIRKWGTVGDGYLGPAFHRRFKKGQVLYGSRRTYLRKIAVAEFDGITANTTFVLEPSGEELIPELLPFIMQTEAFTQHSVKQSKGSVNPYINFKDITWFEFALPPKEEQRRIAEFLWAADDHVQTLRHVNSRIDILLQEFVEKFLAEEPGESRPCSDLVVENVRNGFSPPTSSRGLPTLSISAIRDGQVRCEPDNIKYADVPLASVTQFLMRPKDVLVVRGNGNRDLVGRAGIVSTNPENCFYPDLLIRLRFDESKIRPEFACIQWNSRTAHGQLLKRAKSTNGIWKVNGKDVSQQLLKVPKLKAQDGLLRQFQQFDGTIRSARSAFETAHLLGTGLLQQLLSPGNTS